MQREAVKKAINFDLNTKALQRHYPDKKHWRKAYRDIKRFLVQNGFKHRQWSGYVSKQALTRFETTTIIEELSITLPWLKHCVNEFDVTNIGKKHSYLDVISKAYNSTDNLTKYYEAEPVHEIEPDDSDFLDTDNSIVSSTIPYSDDYDEEPEEEYHLSR